MESGSPCMPTPLGLQEQNFLFNPFNSGRNSESFLRLYAHSANNYLSHYHTDHRGGSSSNYIPAGFYDPRQLPLHDINHCVKYLARNSENVAKSLPLLKNQIMPDQTTQKVNSPKNMDTAVSTNETNSSSPVVTNADQSKSKTDSSSCPGSGQDFCQQRDAANGKHFQWNISPAGKFQNLKSDPPEHSQESKATMPNGEQNEANLVTRNNVQTWNSPPNSHHMYSKSHVSQGLHTTPPMDYRVENLTPCTVSDCASDNKQQNLQNFSSNTVQWNASKNKPENNENPSSSQNRNEIKPPCQSKGIKQMQNVQESKWNHQNLRDCCRNNPTCKVEGVTCCSNVNCNRTCDCYRPQSEYLSFTFAGRGKSSNISANSNRKEVSRPDSSTNNNNSKNNTGIQCSVCSKSFADNRSLKRHTLIHRTDKPYQCDVCTKAFVLSGDLKRHLRIHSGERPFACEICERRFSLKGNLMQHLQTHTPDKQFACTLCGKKFAQKDSLQRHLRAHYGEKPFECNLCCKKFSLKGDLTRHLLIHSGMKPHACPVCDRKFSLKGNLNQHMRTHSGEKGKKGKSQTDKVQSHVEDDGSSRTLLNLDQVQTTKSLGLQTLLDTSRSVTSDRPDVHFQSDELSSFSVANPPSDGWSFCSECSKSFSSVDSLYEHVQHTHEMFSQDGKAKSNDNYLNQKQLNHEPPKGSVVKPYRCDLCEKHFALKGNLKQHLLVHSKEVVSCPVCSKCFGNARNLKLHLKRHETSSCGFSCSNCGRVFLAKTDHFFHQCVQSSQTNQQYNPTLLNLDNAPAKSGTQLQTLSQPGEEYHNSSEQSNSNLTDLSNRDFRPPEGNSLTKTLWPISVNLNPDLESLS